MGITDPKILIDHINHNVFDNRKENLREVNKSQNGINSELRSDNKSGVKGVSFDKTRNKWTVRLRLKDKYLFLGRYSDFVEATKVRKKYEDLYYGEYNYSKK